MSDAHEAIRKLLATYCDLMDSGDFAGLAALFADATLADEKGNVFATGSEEVQAMWERQTILYEGSPRTRHITANPVIDIDEADGVAASNSSYIVFQGTDEMPLQPIISGRYEDLFYLGAEGDWHWQHRAYAVDHLGDLSNHLRR
jgi:ketosteroid isomerase-like protein